MTLKKTLPLALAALFVVAASAQAVTITFYKLTNNGNPDVADQLTAELTAGPGANQVSFEFLNDVGIESSITDIYFDDGTLLGIASVVNSAGVSFSQGASPGNLPGGGDADPPFVTSAGFNADSNPPVMENGVNASTESVTIIFNLLPGVSFDDTVAALGTGDLRIGLHVQAIGEPGGSDSYINKVPDGGLTLSLLGIGLGGLGLFARRRN